VQPRADVIVDVRFIDAGILGVLVNAYTAAESSADVQLAAAAPPSTPAAKLFELVGARDFIPTFPSFRDAVDR
jgi:anti-anti-sigma regulatory factor